jgi:hypothetical protein
MKIVGTHLIHNGEGSQRLVLVTATVVIAIIGGLSAFAQSVVNAGGNPPPRVTYSTRSDTTAPLRSLPQLPPLPKVLGEVFERPRKLLPNRQDAIASDTATDSALQTAGPQSSAPTTGPYFDGVGNVNSVLPPDPSGAVGPNHYVQMVNLSFAIWNKTGSKLMGPVGSNTLWQGFGGACETSNDGDPVVLYDRRADRFMMSQFALPNYPRGPFYQCIAVSQTPDPTGAWHRYEFTISQDKLNDYPKFGVWPDAYYMSINQFNCKFISCNWAGAAAVAFERSQMLTGSAARMVSFDLYTTDANLGGLLPSDLEGPDDPPADAPNYFAQMDDDAWGYSGDQLQLWEFKVNWSNPAASTFQLAQLLPVVPFDSNMCGYSRNCIPQGGTTIKVDSLSDRLMFRLQYRNLGGTPRLLLNHTVDVGSDRAGIRWYELTRPGSSWTIAQQSTYAPADATHRWIGSVAMNKYGSIGLGFSRSGSSLKPMISATGRKAGDPINTMTQPEIAIKAGTGYQTHSSGRWGDYTQLTVDPNDDCTFWYTNEYYNSGASSAGWSTHIGSFQLGDCGGTGNQTPTASFTSSCTNLECSFNGNGSTDSDGSIAAYEWNFGDGQTATGATTSHLYAAAGIFTVALKVTDNLGASNTITQAVTVNSSGTSGTMHVVTPLTGASSSQGKIKWKATVTVTIHNEANQAVANAQVNGSFNPGGTVTCTTGTNGQCSVSLIGISNSTTSVIYKVNSVTSASYQTLTFTSGTEPSITVSK